MSFTANQRTGLLSEMDVARLFTQWSWPVGHDLLDVGYDLCVEPQRPRFLGARFLVQVKGTAIRQKGKIVARVSKARLRDYASNVTPVFIVRVLADGQMIWINAQDWCKRNSKKLTGSGEAGVVLDARNQLANREEFEQALLTAFQVLPNQMGATSALVRQRKEYFAELDPRLSVDISAEAHREVYRISATAEAPAVEAQIKMTCRTEGENALTEQALSSLMAFGLPTKFRAETFSLTGSPVFSQMGLDRKTGLMTVSGESRGSCLVSLQPGARFDPCVRRLSRTAEIYGGSRGLSLVAPEDGFIQISAIMELVEAGVNAKITLTIKESLLTGQPLVNLRELDGLHELEKALYSAGHALLTFEFSQGRMSSVSQMSELEDIIESLSLISFLSRVRCLCCALESDYAVPEKWKFSSDEVSQIELAYRLMRGERVPVKMSTTSFDPAGPIGEGGQAQVGVYVIESSLGIMGSGISIGCIPVRVEASGYRAILDGEGRFVGFIGGESPSAYMAYAEGSVASP